MSLSVGFVAGNLPRIDVYCREDAMLNFVSSASVNTTYARM